MIKWKQKWREDAITDIKKEKSYDRESDEQLEWQMNIYVVGRTLRNEMLKRCASTKVDSRTDRNSCGFVDRQ